FSFIDLAKRRRISTRVDMAKWLQCYALVTSAAAIGLGRQAEGMVRVQLTDPQVSRGDTRCLIRA
ncbi:hypothetical protein LA345_35195, partial (plasmid) [Burkholderia vietnamiensis]|nr:hypothetical protein [Burkholderia vietnamiensis]